MKQNDIITLIVTIFVAVVLSILVSNSLFSSNPNKLNDTVYQAPRISSSFKLPSSKYFNSQSIDPTQIINIAPSNNQQIFNSAN